MAGLSQLREVYEKKGKSFLLNLLNKQVIISENINSTYVGVKRNSNQAGFTYYKKDGKIGYIDRVLSKFYEPIIEHFSNINESKYSELPSNYIFGFDYIPNSNTKLSINHIKIINEAGDIINVIHDKELLTEWANLLGVGSPLVLFQGKLSDDQKVKIQEFVHTPTDQLCDKFKTISFTKHILSILNEDLFEDDRTFNEIVFRFIDESDDSGTSSVLAKVIDPVFYENSKKISETPKPKKSDDYVWIIVIDLMNYIERYRLSELRSFELSGESVEERYISLINEIFIQFINEFGKKYSNLDINVPEFLKTPEFDVNLELTNNEKVNSIIDSNLNYKEIYRIFINIFRKKKISVKSVLFNDEMVNNLNDQIDKLYKIVIGNQLYEDYLPTFSEFIGEESEPGYFETYDRDTKDDLLVKRVNLLVSEYQPITNEHIKYARKIAESTNIPIVFVCIHPNKITKRFRLSVSCLKNALEKIVNSDPLTFSGYVIIPDGDIESILRGVKPKFEPINIAANHSRIVDLGLQLQLAKKKSRNLNIKRNLKLVELPDFQTIDEVFNALMTNDYLKFKELTPSSIHSDFYNFANDISSINESKNRPTANVIIEKDIIN